MRVCLIGATHPTHNPRLLREADSLAEAGHEVKVLTPSFMIDLGEKDERQIARRKWQHHKIDFRPITKRQKIRSFIIRGRRRAASELHKTIKHERLAEYSYTTALPELTREALREPADWFIAHAHAALPVAAAAASKFNARLGFDCEDLLAEHGTDPPEIVRLIERKYLSRCEYVSVPSLGIAERLKEDYDIKQTVVLYNVFPLYLTKGMLPPNQRRKDSIVRLHWFSQTIGQGRGIEEAVEAAGMINEGVELHLRGQVNREYELKLYELAKKHKATLKIHPQVDHDDLIREMEQFDVGLALERPENANYSITVTNKIFSYMLAGLAVAATNVQGQREVFEQSGSAGFLYQGGNPKELADGLRRWLENRSSLLNAQQCAWDEARKRFCWDVEKNKFLHIIECEESEVSNPCLVK